MSPGILYPILHKLNKEEILEVEKRIVEGKERKYYSITPKGVLEEAKIKIKELSKELI